jgi:hypothetical protein
MKLIVALLLVAVRSAAAQARSGRTPTTYDAVLAGKRCTENKQQHRLCEYRVGKSLHFSIGAVGEPDAGITFFHVDWDGDYYARFGVQHGCVIVQRGAQLMSDSTLSAATDYAFVSPKNGKVYRTWEECRDAR